MKKKIIALIIVMVAVILAFSLYISLNKGDEHNGINTQKNALEDVQKDVLTDKESNDYTITEMPSSDDFTKMVEDFDSLEDGTKEKEELRKKIEAVLEFAEGMAN